MSAAHLPSQPPPPRGSVPLPTVAPHASEASRLLCAGTYLDAAYRDRVIDELYLREQRIVAPSLGFDAARVLAHALRARRVELAWASAMSALLVAGAVVSKGLLLLLVIPGLLMALGQWMHSTAENSAGKRRLFSFVVRGSGWGLFVYLLLISLDIASEASEADDEGGTADTGPSWLSLLYMALGYRMPGPSEARLALTVMLVMAACVAGQQSHFIRVLRGELSPQGFLDIGGDPVERFRGRRFQRLKHRIQLEQRVPLVMYHEARPFCGAGTAHDTWVLAVELRPDPAKERRPIGNRTILAAVRPLLEQLRDVAESAEQAGHVVRDRLRCLEIDECVYLPVDGLPRREDAPYNQASFEQHRASALEGGGEKRRHFLRIRVGGWGEELVVTVFVRVHTQGRMLMLEIASHVLYPVRADFKDADHAAYRFANRNAFGKAVLILSHVPSAPGQTLVVLGRRVVHGWRRLTREFADDRPDGPAVSVREIAAEPDGSLFQSMDVDRYLRSVQDRIAYGVKAAIAEAGYQTGEFAQKVIYISSGGVNIDSVEGSTFAVGDHARATTTRGGQAPLRRASDNHGQ